MSKSEFSDKIQQCKFAYQSYEKILIDLKSYLRGIMYEETVLLSDLKLLDSIINHLCPPINGWAKKYGKTFKRNTS